VPEGAAACPECGSDDRTGWSDETIYDGTGIEEPRKFDYDAWLRKEGVKPPRVSIKRLVFVLAAILLLAALLSFLF
jgi:hypothetical protein